MAMVATAEPSLFCSMPLGKEEKQRSDHTKPKPQPPIPTPTPSAEIPTAGWQNAVLTRLGLYHPLEQCRTTFPTSKLPTVLTRLTHAFQVLSLQTGYHNSPVAADCTAQEQVGFRVSFWESRDDSNSCIVEVQRFARFHMHHRRGPESHRRLSMRNRRLSRSRLCR